jgi:hypothetical protein
MDSDCVPRRLLNAQLVARLPISLAIIRRKSGNGENWYYICIAQIIALSYGDHADSNHGKP